MANDHIIIKGIPVPAGQASGIRKEISTWATEKPEESIQVSLFIRALQKLFDTPYTDRLSFFQIAGIHGYPGDARWDNSDKPANTGSDWTHYVYCTHNMITFPTWHRPYMLLFEQTLFDAMHDVINKDLVFTNDADKRAWIKERSSWRLPYWDWADPNHDGNVPKLFMTPPNDISIRRPAAADGSLVDPEAVPNPLGRFQLKVKGVSTKMGDLPRPYRVDDVIHNGLVMPFSQCSGTNRWGIQSETPDDATSQGINNYTGIKNAINGHGWYVKGNDPTNPDLLQQRVGDLVYRLLSSVPKWAQFATTLGNDPVNAVPWEQWLSVEYVHNNLHGFIGGNDYTLGVGHMQSVPVAAFDPIFFVHHCNIDRIYAIWQTLFDDWFPHVTPPTVDESTTPLAPFHITQDRYFNSNDTKVWTEWGYQYDILVHQPGESQEHYIKRIKLYIEHTYPSNTGKVLRQDRGSLFDPTTVSKDQDIYNDYIIDVLYDRYALNGDPYTIHFFLGKVHSSIESFNIKDISPQLRYVGSVYNFSTPMGPANASAGARCANCEQQRDSGLLSTALVPLTIPVYQAFTDGTVTDVSDLRKDNVEPYLKDNLNWVAVRTNGMVLQPADLPRTKVFILKGKGTHYDDTTKLSDYSKYDAMAEVTEGKPWGASLAEYQRQRT